MTNTKVETIKLCSHKVKTKEGELFDSYYCFLGHYDPKEEKFIADTYTDKNNEVKDKSVRVHLCDPILSTLKKDNNFPYIVELDPSKKINDKPSYYLTIDKDTDGIIRLDKNGNKHYIIIVYDVKSYKHIDPEQRALDSIEF